MHKGRCDSSQPLLLQAKAKKPVCRTNFQVVHNLMREVLRHRAAAAGGLAAQTIFYWLLSISFPNGIDVWDRLCKHFEPCRSYDFCICHLTFFWSLNNHILWKEKTEIHFLFFWGQRSRRKEAGPWKRGHRLWRTGLHKNTWEQEWCQNQLSLHHVHETVTEVLTQLLLDGLEQAEITVKLLQEQVELPLRVCIPSFVLKLIPKQSLDVCSKRCRRCCATGPIFFWAYSSSLLLP